MLASAQAPPEAATALEDSRPESDLADSAALGLDLALTLFIAERTHLLRVAYGIVGNRADAEDVVQDAWIRWQRTNRDGINNPAAFLTTTTTHLAINVIQSAKHRHETPTDSPLIESVDPAQDPCGHAEQAASIDQALGLIMAKLTPAERAAYLLRKGFDYPYQEIARVLRTTVPNARQLAHRAQHSLAVGRAHGVDPESHRRLVHAVLAASQTGRLADLEGLLGEVARPARRRLAPAASGGVG